MCLGVYHHLLVGEYGQFLKNEQLKENVWFFSLENGRKLFFGNKQNSERKYPATNTHEGKCLGNNMQQKIHPPPKKKLFAI